MKTTAWFSHDVKPVRDGWYELKGEFIEGTPTVRRHWSSTFGWRWIDPERRQKRMTQALVWRGDNWRGLAEKPRSL